MTNIIRHSEGDHVLIKLIEKADNTYIEIFDNGRVTELEFGNGLLGVNERIERLGGHIDINTTQGCLVKLFLPAAVVES